MIWLTILAIQFGGCTRNDSLEPDLGLIQPYSYDLQSNEPFAAPFLTRFKHGRRELVYIAASHENRVGSTTFELIDRAFGEHDFRMVILEGFPASRGLTPRSIVQNFEGGRDGDFYRWGEPAYAALKARDLGIPFIGGEPDEEDVIREAREAGFSAQDMAGFYFVRRIPQFVRDAAAWGAPLWASSMTPLCLGCVRN